jgi:hypothetical protein
VLIKNSPKGFVLTFSPELGSPDFENPFGESDNSYNVQITVDDHDPETPTDDVAPTLPLTVIVTDSPEWIDEEENGIGARMVFVQENTSGAVDYQASLVGGEGPWTLELLGDDKGFFSINPVTGRLFFDTALDFENPTDVSDDGTYDLIIRGTGSNGNYSDLQLVIVITDVTEGSGGGGGGSPAAPPAAPVDNQPPTSSRELSLINTDTRVTNIRVNLPSSFSGGTVKIYNNQKDKTVFVGSGRLNRFGNITITPNQPIKPGSLFAMVGGNIVKVITIN